MNIIALSIAFAFGVLITLDAHDRHKVACKLTDSATAERGKP